MKNLLGDFRPKINSIQMTSMQKTLSILASVNVESVKKVTTSKRWTFIIPFALCQNIRWMKMWLHTWSLILTLFNIVLRSREVRIAVDVEMEKFCNNVERMELEVNVSSKWDKNNFGFVKFFCHEQNCSGKIYCGKFGNEEFLISKYHFQVYP